MNPKLLLALALVGAMHAGEPVPPDVIYPVITIPSDFPKLASTITLPAEFSGKIVVHNEPTVTRKADGSWEITFAGKKAALSALTVPNTPEIQAQVLAPYAVPVLSPPIGEHAKELEAASNILPPAPPTVLWPNEVWQAESDKRTLDNPNSLNWAQKFTVEVSGKRYEFGLRSDGCVVWRERK